MASSNPTSSIIFFLLLTLGYSIFKYYTTSPKMIKMWSVIYFLILISVQFFINLGVTTNICGFSQYGVALKTTLFPWLIVFGTINLLLFMFPAWLSPFSNTIGYLFAYITGVNGFLKSILKDKTTLQLGKEQADMMSAINNVYTDKALLINSITLENIDTWWDRMSKGGLLKKESGPIGSEFYKKLLEFVKLKTQIAEYIWYALTGILVTSVSYNYILNSGCTQSAEEMEKRHNEYLAQEQKLSTAQKEQGKNQIIYKTYE